MPDKDIIKLDMRSLIAKLNMINNNDIGEMKNLASEIQIKQFKGIIVKKEQNIEMLIFTINNMKE